MKKIIFILTLFIATIGFAQNIDDLSSFNIETESEISATVKIPVIPLKVIELNNIDIDSMIFNYLYGTISFDSLNAKYFTILGKELNSKFYDIKDVSEVWYIFYDNKVKPMLDYYIAKYDLFGETGVYYPDTMTYYGYMWSELQDRENKEGFTNEIRLEWIKLYKEMKPYYIPYLNE